MISTPKELKIHPAINYFLQLQSSEPSNELKDWLSSFSAPKTLNTSTFIEGAKKFIQIANSNPLDTHSNSGRKKLYGDVYSGIHYGNDLAKLWNSREQYELTTYQLANIRPNGWERTQQHGAEILIYKGDKPAEALDELVKGPTVIDCGMFCQLALWFGIRNMLGNDRFNQCFGKTPFFITQFLYNDVLDSNRPYSGNPLFAFLSTQEKAQIPTVTVRYFQNHDYYLLKHPGGNYNGDNTIVIDDQFFIFDPHLNNTQGIQKSDVLNLLRNAFNENQQPYDKDRLSLYTREPHTMHSTLMRPFEELIQLAKKFEDLKLSEEEFLNVTQNPALDLTFDLKKFTHWLNTFENPSLFDAKQYIPKQMDSKDIPERLLKLIPFENRLSMDFSKFKEETQQQKELMTIAKQFCRSVLEGKSRLVILTGKAGIGKTASAVCAVKELTALNKKVVWISEVMVNGWANKASSIKELEQCKLNIVSLLKENPDAVFLDDDNLAGFSGRVLLEELYSWYVSNPGKSLFITSNEPVQFKNCYGLKLDGTYDYPPFCHYDSAQYMNRHQETSLGGKSLRTRKEGQSIGFIVSDSEWNLKKHMLQHVEFIPGFDNDIIASICRSLRNTGILECEDYKKLSSIQKKWLGEHLISGTYNRFERYVKPFSTVYPIKFHTTQCKIIALEVREYMDSFTGREIYYHSHQNIINILNFAHDNGGRRVILINQTSFSNKELLLKIKEQLPKAEQERTGSRLELLFSEGIETFSDMPTFEDDIPTESNETKPSFHKSMPMVTDCLMVKKRERSRFLTLQQRKESKSRLEDTIKTRFFCDSNQLSMLVDKYITKHRHDNTELQHEYDKQHGLILTRP